jgi:8-oxo-dGTP pyrophosphatase MutT (NUDIX family)
LREEAGISCKNLELAGTIMIDVNMGEGILLFVFTGDDTTGELIHSEEGSLHWVDISQMGELEVVEDVPELVANVLKHKETGQLFYGRYLYNDRGVRISDWTWT